MDERERPSRNAAAPDDRCDAMRSSYGGDERRAAGKEERVREHFRPYRPPERPP
jgi:hypothetical protein